MLFRCLACKKAFETMNKLRRHQIKESHPASFEKGKLVGREIVGGEP